MNSVHSASPAHATPAPSFSNLAVIVLCSYIAAQMMADIASLKIGQVGGWAVDMGTFIYPLAGQQLPALAAVEDIAAWRWDGERFVEIPVQVDERAPYFLANGNSEFSIYSGTDP